MHLTRLILNPENPHARRDLASAYNMHRTLARAFAPDEARPPARFLWRLEEGPPAVLVQSAAEGDWAALAAQPGYLARGLEAKHVSRERLVEAGRRFAFRLLANPTVCRAGKRFPLIREEAQTAWLERQGAQHGFVVLSAAVTGRSRSVHKNIVAARVRFDGVLQARDPGQLREALTAGIGPSKAFGCGLLSLAPCR